jgi:hypothetical protein
MFVNRHKIKVGSLPGGTGSTMMIPFSMDFFPVDNSELVQKEFVEKETKNAINPLVNYEKVKFIPSFSGTTNQILNPQIDTIKINLFKTNGTPLYYGDIGMTNEDVKFRRNRFLETFLRLSFYDSTSPTTQNLLFFNTYFTNIGTEQRNPITKQPLDVSSMPITYTITNPLKNDSIVSENYYIVWRVKDVIENFKNLYTSITFNNAVNGKTTQYVAIPMTTPISISSPNFNDNLYVRYLLNKENDSFKYFVDNSNRSILINNNQIIINLYPLLVE